MRRCVLLAAAALLLLVGCAAQDSTPAPYTIYCRANLDSAGGGDAVYPLAVDAEGENDERIASDLLEQMLHAGGEEYDSAIPKGTRVLSVTIADGQAVVDFSEEYARLSGMDLTIADYCVTLSLCQLDTVERVSVLVEGQPLPYRTRQSFMASDVLLSWMDEELRTLRARLFFCNAETGELASETRTLRLYEGQTKSAAVLEALLLGPEDESLVSVLPEGLEVQSVRVEDGICYVSLPKAFLEEVPDSRQMQENVIYCLVKSLCSVSDIQAVQIVVDGEVMAYYGAVDISAPLS